MAMQLGASLPCGDIGTGAAVVRDYVQTLEGMGFDYLQAPDHVLGGNPATVPPGKRSARPKPPTMIRSCCSALSQAARSGSALPPAC